MAFAFSRKVGERRLGIRIGERHEGVGRIEAFSDGVFAIAATLLGVDLKVPRGVTDPVQLRHGLDQNWPVYVSYALSFFYIGVFWATHYSLVKHFKGTDHLLLKINTLFLMVIAVIPFSTALLAEYWKNPELKRLPAVIYSGTLFVSGALFFGVWVYGAYKGKLLREGMSPQTVLEHTIRLALGPIFLGIAFLVSIAGHPNAALVIIFAITLFYVFAIQISLE